MEMWDKIYEMKLGETLKDSQQRIVRVPGGWVYIYVVFVNGTLEQPTSVFIPYNNEFWRSYREYNDDDPDLPF